MTNEEIQKIEEVIQNYKNKKDELKKNILEIEKLRENEEISEWSKDIQIDDLYSEAVNIKERIKFQQMVKRTESDAEFEKFFRAKHMEIYYNFIVDPTKL